MNWNDVYFNLIPTMQVYNEDGTYNGLNPVSGSFENNPVADINELIDHNLVTNLLANAYAEYDLVPNLTLRSSVGSN